MLEDFTYKEIEDIIIEHYLSVKEKLEMMCSIQQISPDDETEIKVRECQYALKATENLMEDLTVEFDDGIILEDDYD